jgi:UDP-N-acetylglucosamine enolpyruvyl transferase
VKTHRVATLVALLWAASTTAQGEMRRGLPGGIALGPRLLDYPMECVGPGGCQIECFQHGVKVVSRTGIGQQDGIRLVASAGAAGNVTPRWIEIRSSGDDGVQTLLLTADSFCDLNGLLISPKNRP